jgi:hypothetical protein
MASYAGALASKHSRDRRAIITSDLYREYWNVRLKDDANRQTDFENANRGSMQAVAVGGRCTGLGGDTIIADDLINPDQAESEAERGAGLRWYTETLSSRLNNKKTGQLIIVEQRTHVEDLTGFVLKNQTGWTHLSLPAEFEKRTVYSLPSGKQIAMEPGDLLWPEREGRKQLDEARERVGAHAFRSAMVAGAGRPWRQPFPAGMVENMDLATGLIRQGRRQPRYRV